MGIRRKNITPKQKHEVLQCLKEGLSVGAVAGAVGLCESTVYKIRHEAHKADQVDHPHQQTLRKLTQCWLDEARQLDVLKKSIPVMDQFLSASGLLRLAQEVQKSGGLGNLQTKSQSDHASQQVPEGGQWVALAEKDAHFSELRGHLTGDPALQFYGEMSSDFAELVVIILHWTQGLQGHVVGLLASTAKDSNVWEERLRQDALFREQIALIDQPAFYLLASELLILAIADVASSPQLDSFKLTLELLQSQWEHKLQAGCSLSGFEFSADKVRRSAREGWAGHGLWESSSIWDDLKKDLSRALKLWPAWQTSRNALQERLAAIAEQKPFPGRCSACPV
ncbi:MAG: hypothetical protein NTZ04_02780 [Chloroflexi bacterium]|nr:hypothetical protein [Chloroflexota bacterium]